MVRVGDSNSRHLAPKASALPTALHPVMKFSNCGQIWGQRRVFDQFPARGKTPSALASQSFPDFGEVWLELRPHAPKSRALPTALHPDISFFCMIPCGEGKSKFFVSVGGTVVKPDFAGVFQPENFRRKLLPQGLPGFSHSEEWMSCLSSQITCAANCATPGYSVFCMIPCEEGKASFSCLWATLWSSPILREFFNREISAASRCLKDFRGLAFPGMAPSSIL